MKISQLFFIAASVIAGGNFFYKKTNNNICNDDFLKSQMTYDSKTSSNCLKKGALMQKQIKETSEFQSEALNKSGGKKAAYAEESALKKMKSESLASQEQYGISFDDYKIDTYNAMGYGVDLPNTTLKTYESQSQLQQKSEGIFETAWLKTIYSYGVLKPYSTAYSGAKIGHTISEMISKMSTCSSVAAEGKASYGPYKASVASSLNTSLDNNLRRKSENLFFNATYYRTLFRYTLPSLDEYSEMYQSHFTNSYVKAVQNLLSNNTLTSMKEFAEKYGTHILTEAVYGGAYDIYYKATSTEYDLTNSAAVSATNKIGGGGEYEGVKFEGETSSNFSLSASLGLSTNQISEELNAYFYGGKSSGTSLIDTDKQTIANNASIWTDSVDELPTTIDYTKVCIFYQFLPTALNNATNREKLSNLYNKYVDYCNEHPKQYVPDSEPYVYDSVTVIKSTDYDYFGWHATSHYDKHYLIDLNKHKSLNTYDLNELKKYGYLRAKFSVSFQLKEVYYNFPDTKVDISCGSYSNKFIDGNISKKYWEKYNYNYIFSTDIDNLSSNSIDLHFDTNKWALFMERKIQIKDLVLKIEYSK